MIDVAFWRGRRVLVTGHTGFKGAWLSLWLQQLGAEVTGLALEPPSTPSLFALARVGEGMTSLIGDVRDLGRVRAAVREARPEIVLHLAAQPLVRLSYAEPVETYAVNVLGTVHVLEAIRHEPTVRAAVIVTSDKCYENREWLWPYREDEAMGGYDPYSSSKGCAELVTAAYRRSFFSRAEGGPPPAAIASARAGNVIGGGDWAKDRLVPDIMQAILAGRPVVIRNPDAVRPWQHVVEPLAGYLELARRLTLEGARFAEGWNFGPFESDARPVSWIVERLTKMWGGDASWALDSAANPHEARHLKLDCSKARALLGWRPRWELDATLGRIVEWYRAYARGEDVREATLRQIADYSEAA